jgi:hypothetical protein
MFHLPREDGTVGSPKRRIYRLILPSTIIQKLNLHNSVPVISFEVFITVIIKNVIFWVWLHVVSWEDTDISEVFSTSIIRDSKYRFRNGLRCIDKLQGRLPWNRKEKR